MNPDITYTKNPDLSLAGKNYCFTGKFDERERGEFERYIERKGATFSANVSMETDYLVIGSKGTRCCSFSCCKRVVERALELKTKGAPLLFIKESDFLDVMIP